MIDENGLRILKPVPDKSNHSLNVVDPLSPISLEFIRRGLFCWLHYALLPHSGPFNRILPGIEFSFECRGWKPHLSFFFPPSDLCSLQNKRKRREQTDTAVEESAKTMFRFSHIAHTGRLVLKNGIFVLINVALIGTNIFFKYFRETQGWTLLCAQPVLLQCAI